jgi:hypothetical protein
MKPLRAPNRGSASGLRWCAILWNRTEETLSQRAPELGREANSPFTCPGKTDVVEVTDGITSIEVTPEEIPFRGNGFAGAVQQERLSDHRHATGARVTVEFSSSAPSPPNSPVRVYYDIAENGGLREIEGIPQLTHTTVRQGRPGRSYHYRLSHWIVAPSVMQFVLPQCTADSQPDAPAHAFSTAK